MRVELRLVVDWGASIPEVGRTVQERVRDYLVQHGGRRAGSRGRRRRRGRARCRDAHRRAHRRDAADRADGLPRVHLLAVADGRSVDKRRWIRGTEEEWGAWGTVYYDDDGRLLGSMQYGPSDLFPRAAELPAGPPSEDAVLVTCAYLVDSSKPWVMQSLFLTAIGDARDKGARALEAFAYRYGDERLDVRALPACTRRSFRATSSPTSAS